MMMMLVLRYSVHLFLIKFKTFTITETIASTLYYKLGQKFDVIIKLLTYCIYINFSDREDSNQASTSSLRNSSIDLVELLVHSNNKIHEIKMSGSATVSEYNFSVFI